MMSGKVENRERKSHRRLVRVLQRIWHTADERYYEPGETCDVSHLDLDSLQVLLESGTISEVEEEV